MLYYFTVPRIMVTPSWVPLYHYISKSNYQTVRLKTREQLAPSLYLDYSRENNWITQQAGRVLCSLLFLILNSRESKREFAERRTQEPHGHRSCESSLFPILGSPYNTRFPSCHSLTRNCNGKQWSIVGTGTINMTLMHRYNIHNIVLYLDKIERYVHGILGNLT